MEDVCFTAGAGRRHFERRAAIVVDSIDNARTLLSQLQRGTAAADIYLGAARALPKVAWQFTGQGAQYVGMAQQLYQSQSVFRNTLDRCEELMRGWRRQSLLEVMFHDEAALNQTTWTQPALFAMEIGLADLLQSWGLQPDFVLGHSVGQFAAAYVAGILGLDDGLRLITERSRLTGDLPAGGGMAAVFANEATVIDMLGDFPLLSIAANNGSHTVISGEQKSLTAALAKLADSQVRHKRLTTSHAFHSALMEPAMEEWRSIAASVEFRPARIPVVCNVTGKLLDPDFVFGGDYWAQHLRQAVQFAESIKTISDLGCEVVLEVGPQPVLNGMAASCWPGSNPALIPTLQKDRPDEVCIISALAQLYTQGVNPDFSALAPKSAKKIELPTYPFQRKRYWGAAIPQASKVERDSSHALLGGRQQLAGVKDESRYESQLSTEKPPWLNDHQVFGDVVFPGAAYVEMALSVAQAGATLQDVAFEMPMRLQQPTLVQTVVKPAANSRQGIEIYSSSEQNIHWTRNFSGNILPGQAATAETLDLQQIKQRCSQSVSVTEFYDSVRNLGLQYGPQFQTIREIFCGQGEVLVRLETDGDVLGYVIPPMLMDGAFQSLAVGLLQDADSSFYLPVGMERLDCFSPVSGEVYSLAQWRDAEGEVRNADLTLFTSDGTVLARIEKLRLRPCAEQPCANWPGPVPID